MMSTSPHEPSPPGTVPCSSLPFWKSTHSCFPMSNWRRTDVTAKRRSGRSRFAQKMVSVTPEEHEALLRLALRQFGFVGFIGLRASGLGRVSWVRIDDGFSRFQKGRGDNLTLKCTRRASAVAESSVNMLGRCESESERENEQRVPDTAAHNGVQACSAYSTTGFQERPPVSRKQSDIRFLSAPSDLSELQCA